MRTLAAVSCLLFAGLGATALSLAQNPAAQNPAAQTPAAQNPAAQSQPEAGDSKALKTSGEEVMVDVIVRDKKGRAITNLAQSEFSVFDNGQQRPIHSFRIVTGADALNAQGEKTQLDPMRQVRLVTLIFERMDLNGRRLARQAALDLLKDDIPRNVYMGVFALDQKLEALQLFTNDRELLRKAIEHATSGAYSEYLSNSAQIQKQIEDLTGPNQSGKLSLEEQIGAMPVATDGHGSPNGAQEADRAMAEIMLNTLRFDQRIELAQSGRSSIFALLAAVQAQYRLPGRKTVLYFSPGFFVPPGLEETFQNIISTANRFNISFYTIDARGLQTTSLNKEAISQLSAAGIASTGNQVIPSNSETRITIEQAQSVDTALNSGKYNTQDTLAMLAEETGGFLVANTNDFRAPLHKITEDIQTYYEITYSPQLTIYDGSFRKISVKTSRPDLRIQSRAGYFALPPSMTKGNAPMAVSEVPLLKALNDVAASRALTFESAGLHFRGDGRDQTCEFVVEVPFQNVTVEKDTATGKYVGGLSYEALIKNDAGEVVKKLHGDLPLAMSEDQVFPFHQSRFTDTEYFDVPAGRYTLETAILDKQSGRTSTRKSVLMIPRADSRLAMSSVTLIRSWKPKEAGATEDDPFVVADKSVMPTLSTVINKSVSTSLPFYVVIYPDQGNSAKPELTMEFNRDGEALRVGAAPMNAPDANGRIQYVATAPLEQLQPGDYAIRFVVRQGAEAVEESIALKLEP